jgi:hypothetical protein
MCADKIILAINDNINQTCDMKSEDYLLLLAIFRPDISAIVLKSLIYEA